MLGIRLVPLVMAGLVLATAAQAAETVVGSTHATVSLHSGSYSTIISASSNTKGVRLKSAVLYVTGAGAGSIDLDDGTPILGAFAPSSGGAIVNLPAPLYLPPGVGLQASVDSTGDVYVTYDVP